MRPDAPAGPPRFVPPASALVPTAEQLAIQTATAPTLLVEARAGAAKTTSLALRLAESWSRGAYPSDCLVLTYTEAACTAFRQALLAIGVPADVARRFRIATFEDFAAGVLLRIEGGVPVPLRLQPEALRAGVWEAVDAVTNRADERWPDQLEYPSAGDQGFVADFLERALWLKGTLRLEREPPEGPVTPDYAEGLGQGYMALRTLRAYERLRAGGHPDRPAFRGPADATYDLARLLVREEEEGMATYPGAWPQGLRVLLVDEMHDMNEAMFRILRQLLRSREVFFCGVGDVDQVIHAAAGADAAFLRGRIDADTARRADIRPLGTSFRFGERLARPAARFIGKPLASGGTRETAVALCAYDDDAACAARVLADIRAYRGRSRQAAGLAVLLRHEHQSILLENALVDGGIAYRMAGFESYLLRPEVLLVRGLLTIATRDFASMQGRETLGRIVEAFVLFCGTRFDEDPEQPDLPQAALMASAVRDFADSAENLPRFLENHVLRKAEPGVARRLRAAIAVAGTPGGPALFGRFLDALDMPWFVAQALVRPERRAAALHNLAGLRALAAGYPTSQAFFQHLQDTATRQAGLRKSASLTLASAAAVKGLEFEEVLLPFLEQGEFPDRDGSPDDEANLFYVAITRARTALRLYAHATRPSMFVAQAGWRLPPVAAQVGAGAPVPR